MEQSNFVTEHLLSGNVTLNLVSICVAVATMAVLITLWAVKTFQTKVDAKEQDNRHHANLKADSDGHRRANEETRAQLKTAFDGLHDHMATMKEDNKSDIRGLQSDISLVRNTMSQVASDLSFLRGRAEANNSRGIK